MKIALIGNMNNNNFSLMRYFRDLGADAHLLCCFDEFLGGMQHFAPKADTWDITKWQPYIHELPFSRGFSTLIGNPKKFKFPPSKNVIYNSLKEYDIFIGSGLTPAIMHKAGLKLTIFYPYSLGIECINEPSWTASIRNTILKRYFYLYTTFKQKQGIRATKVCLTGDYSEMTEKAFLGMGVRPKLMHIPMVYNKELNIGGYNINIIPENLKQNTFTVLSAARHCWIKKSSCTNSEWAVLNKNNQWLFDGFKKFIDECKPTNAKLILFEYGEDYEDSKHYLNKLDLSKYVVWIPKTHRKQITALLKHVDVVVGEFVIYKDHHWGGTGWEALALGKPLLQTVNEEPRQFESKFGYSLPPMLDVKSPIDVASHLSLLFQSNSLRERMSEQAKSWFNINNGIGLAEKWLNIARRAHKISLENN